MAWQETRDPGDFQTHFSSRGLGGYGSEGIPLAVVAHRSAENGLDYSQIPSQEVCAAIIDRLIGDREHSDTVRRFKVRTTPHRMDEVTNVDVCVAGAKLFHFTVDSAGHSEYLAQLFVKGDHLQLGMANPDPWSGEAETICYARIGMHSQKPDEITTVLIPPGDDLYTETCELAEHFLQEKTRDYRVQSMQGMIGEMRKRADAYRRNQQAGRY